MCYGSNRKKAAVSTMATEARAKARHLGDVGSKLGESVGGRQPQQAMPQELPRLLRGKATCV